MQYDFADKQENHYEMSRTCTFMSGFTSTFFNALFDLFFCRVVG